MKDNLKNRKPDLLKPTLIFSAFGIFIPGFTAIGLLGCQILLSSFGLECHNAWTVIWSIAIIGGLILPILFYRYLKTLTENKNLKTRLILFNLIEYIFIQAGLTIFFTNGENLCYASDGQNGLELVFTAWIALPILIGFSVLFKTALKSKKDVVV